MAKFTRRGFVAASGVASLLAMPGIRRALAAEPKALRWASLQPGFTVLPVQYILANKLGRKNGLSLPDPAPYTAVSTYYNDFVAGNYDVCIGSWDTFAARYQAGVPIKYLCTITDANMIAMLAPKSGVSDVAQLKGKTVAALQSTGTYRMVRALIKEANGIDIEKDATIQNVDNPAASVTLVMADRADAALSWEPNITMGLVKKPDLRVIFKAGDAYHKIAQGGDLPYFGVADSKGTDRQRSGHRCEDQQGFRGMPDRHQRRHRKGRGPFRRKDRRSKRHSEGGVGVEAADIPLPADDRSRRANISGQGKRVSCTERAAQEPRRRQVFLCLSGCNRRCQQPPRRRTHRAGSGPSGQSPGRCRCWHGPEKIQKADVT